MTTDPTSRSAWKRWRLPLLALGAIAWVAGITYLHQSRNRRAPTKGATELLQIGALPVT